MSDNFTADEIENKLSLVVRKPQEGKTSICIKYITDDLFSNNIHIVLTMNTLASGMQFFGRMKEQIGPNRIVVFNSVKKTAGDCHHATNVIDVKSLIRNNNIKVIVCCAHNKKIRDIIVLIQELSDSLKFREQNNKIVIHIDEAHKYIPENRKFITAYNNSSAVTEIIGYSATADGIWTQNRDDSLFYNILIRDVDAQLGLLRSQHYFGVNRCELIAYDDVYNNDDLINLSEISNEISQITFENSGSTSSNNKWFGTRSHFNIGNEILFLSFIKYILPILNISNDTFSYNFMPAYNRKVTHYECMELILKQYSNANVIIMNGKGQQLYRLNQSTGRSYKITDNVEIKQNAYLASEKNALLEPSYMIQQLIKNTPNCPTFITGFTCVGMSVTLINENIGNFDNVVMDHQHFKRDTLYQLCRFLFKYEYWTPENQDKIKTTKFHSLTRSVIDTCIEYEEHIEKICNEFAGTTCTLNEINGKEPEIREPTERELRTIALNSVSLINERIWKKFKVYDGNDDDKWREAEEFYKEVHPKHNGFTTRTRPTLNANGFYECTDSGKKGVKSLSCFTGLEDKWSNWMFLRKGVLSYVRAFVGYDNINDPTEYTIFIKYAQLVDNEYSHKFLNDYAPKKEQTKEEEEDC